MRGRSAAAERGLCPLEPASASAGADEGGHDARRPHRAAAGCTRREPYWITCEARGWPCSPLRWQADAALTGVDTVLADDPLLTDRSGLRRRRPLLRVVLDSALRMPLDSRSLWPQPTRM
jgi:hypothetical protein